MGPVTAFDGNERESADIEGDPFPWCRWQDPHGGGASRGSPGHPRQCSLWVALRRDVGENQSVGADCQTAACGRSRGDLLHWPQLHEALGGSCEAEWHSCTSEAFPLHEAQEL